MNPRTLGIVALVVIVALAGAAGAVYVMYNRTSPAMLAQYETQLDDPSAAVRLEAATGLLKANPNREDVALVRARTLLHLGRYPAARETLRPFRQLERPHVVDSLYLTGESYLRETADKLSHTTAATIDMDDDALRATLSEVEPIAVMLLSMDEPRTRVLGLELRARRLDLEAQIVRVQLRARALQVNASPRPGDTEAVERLDTTGADVHKLEEDGKALDDAMLVEAQAALQIDAARGWPRVLVVQRRLRDGDAAAARAEAAAAISQPTVERLAAGAIAVALLDVENRTGLPRLPGDVELARKLIEHPGATGEASVEFLTARARLALEAGDYTNAESLARELLAQSEGNPSGMAMLADALTGQGRYKEALAMLGPFCERVRFGPAREAMARAYLAQYQKEGAVFAAIAGSRNPVRIDPRDTARTSLRVALNFDPSLLSARFTLTEMLLEQGTRESIAAAESELFHIVRQAPNHPRQLAIHARLIMERQDGAALAALVDRRLAAAAKPLAWRDLAIPSAMVLDDRDLVQRLDHDALAEANDDPMGLIGEAWRQGGAAMRVQMAGVVIRALYDRLEPDPMARTEAPAPPPRRPAAPASTSNRPAPTPSSIERFANPRYIPWNHAVALSVLDTGLERFASHPQLLQMSAQMAMWLGRLDEARRRCAALGEEGNPNTASLPRAMRLFLGGDDLQALADVAEMHGTAAGAQPSVAFIEMAANLRQHNVQAADRALERLLAEHLWLEPAVNYAQHQALMEGDYDRAFRLAEKLNPDTSASAATQPAARRATSAPPIYHVCRARVFAAVGQHDLAFAEIKDALAGEGIQSELRRQCAEIVASANAGADPSNASTQFQTLSVALSDQRMPLQMCALDAAIEFEHDSSAVETALDRLIDADTPPRYLDQVLARAIALVPAARVNDRLDRVLLSKPDEAVGLLYRAQLLEDSEPERAETMLRQLAARFKNQPRPQMTLAGLLARQGRSEEARAIYRSLVEAGGRAAAAARAALSSLPPTAPTAPSRPGTLSQPARP